MLLVELPEASFDTLFVFDELPDPSFDALLVFVELPDPLLDALFVLVELPDPSRELLPAPLTLALPTLSRALELEAFPKLSNEFELEAFPTLSSALELDALPTLSSALELEVLPTFSRAFELVLGPELAENVLLEPFDRWLRLDRLLLAAFARSIELELPTWFLLPTLFWNRPLTSPFVAEELLAA